MIAIDLRDVTSAEASGPVPANVIHRECYAPTEPVHSSGPVLPGPKMQLQSAIQVGQRRYFLNDMFVIDLDYVDDEVLASHRTLPVCGHGSTQREALASFFEAFDFQWRNLVDAASDTLTPGALRLREAMRAVVSNIEQL